MDHRGAAKAHPRNRGAHDMDANDRLADGVDETPGFNDRPVLKVSVNRLRRHKKSRLPRHRPQRQYYRRLAAKLRSSEASLLDSERLIENDGLICRPEIPRDGGFFQRRGGIKAVCRTWSSQPMGRPPSSKRIAGAARRARGRGNPHATAGGRSGVVSGAHPARCVGGIGSCERAVPAAMEGSANPANEGADDVGAAPAIAGVSSRASAGCAPMAKRQRSLLRRQRRAMMPLNLQQVKWPRPDEKRAPRKSRRSKLAHLCAV